ncbi:MAG: YfiM family protein [Chitinophagales bacterium]|jgi:hypothetical protein|nr:YfiM family protein [Chitinophagales bacterium]
MIQKISFYVFFLFLPAFVLAQHQELDSFQPKKFTQITLAFTSGFALTQTALYFAWYQSYPQQGFHFRDDLHQWNGSDKMGHAFSAYALSDMLYNGLRYTGVQKKKSAIFGSLTGFMAVNSIEIMDGFSAQWGASMSDVAANALGSGFFLAQQLLFDKQIVMLKFGFRPRAISDPILQARSNELFGSFPAHIIKDYNASSIWACLHLHQFRPQSKFGFLGLALGIGSQNLYGAEDNKFKLNGIEYDYSSIPRVHEYMLGLDIDWTKIPAKKPWLKTTFKVLNYIRIPLPALQMNSQGEFSAWLLR